MSAVISSATGYSGDFFDWRDTPPLVTKHLHPTQPRGVGVLYFLTSSKQTLAILQNSMNRKKDADAAKNCCSHFNN